MADELFYQFDKQPSQKRLRKNIREDADGSYLEFNDTPDVSASTLSARRPFKSLPVDETSDEELIYALELDSRVRSSNQVQLSLWCRHVSHTGTAGPIRKFIYSEASSLPSRNDAVLLSFLHPYSCIGSHQYVLPCAESDRLFRMLCLAGQIRILDFSTQPRRFAKVSLCQDFSNHVHIAIQEAIGNGDFFKFVPYLPIEGINPPLHQWQFLWENGILLSGGILYRIYPDNAISILTGWMHTPPQLLNRGDARLQLRNIMLSTLLEVDPVPACLKTQTVKVAPRGRLFVRTAKYLHRGKEQLHAEISFDYDGSTCQNHTPGQHISGHGGCIFERDLNAESVLYQRLLALGFRDVSRGCTEEPGLKIPPSKLNSIVMTLVMENWIVTAEGKTYRKPIQKSLQISAGNGGTDWFEVKGNVEFEGETIPLPRLLASLKNSSKSIRLDDGTYGILPSEWLEKYTVLCDIGTPTEDGNGFLLRKQQAALIASLLDERQSESDSAFQALLQKWEDTIHSLPENILPPDGLQATLRPYQLDGLAWMEKMRHLNLGGCLADDMGLGKTIQVLSLLLNFLNHEHHLNALIVTPSSLTFNWLNEAERFTPSLTTATYYGTGRKMMLPALSNFHLVFTTYGIVRQDVEILAKQNFDYIILDESQAIKNIDSTTAQSVRALQGGHRLSMTGTPIENSVTELFSQLEFLNPGLFGDHFVRLAATTLRSLDEEALSRLRHFLSPFLLRRKKEDVATDLPPKTEQVLWCDLNEGQRQLYDELKAYYQQEFRQDSDGAPVKSPGANDMLLALLRLRQTACHPALVNPEQAHLESTKLTVLMEHLEDIIASGHKALIFSQFTSFLKLAEKAIQPYGWKLCYLDGQSKNRADLVSQFQNDPETKLFLISLKAGGTGLNLTAADYVFILDPWWNPASEAQAIDRAYRIGQKKNVFAYKLIAKNTVEEKIHDLQLAKQKIASTALLETGGPPLDLEDMRRLLSL